MTSVAAATSEMPSPGATVLWLAGLLAAIASIYKLLHLGEMFRGTRNFLADYNGEPQRPGFEGRKGLPERITSIEQHMNEVKGAMPSLAQALSDLAETSTSNGEKIDKLDQRVTDHRRRNDEQATLLRTELERRARELESRTDQRNAEVDGKLERLANDLFRAQAGRAILHELGFKVEKQGDEQP